MDNKAQSLSLRKIIILVVTVAVVIVVILGISKFGILDWLINLPEPDQTNGRSDLIFPGVVYGKQVDILSDDGDGRCIVYKTKDADEWLMGYGIRGRKLEFQEGNQWGDIDSEVLTQTQEELRERYKRLESTLVNFKVDGKKVRLHDLCGLYFNNDGADEDCSAGDFVYGLKDGKQTLMIRQKYSISKPADLAIDKNLRIAVAFEDALLKGNAEIVYGDLGLLSEKYLLKDRGSNYAISGSYYAESVIYKFYRLGHLWELLDKGDSKNDLIFHFLEFRLGEKYKMIKEDLMRECYGVDYRDDNEEIENVDKSEEVRIAHVKILDVDAEVRLPSESRWCIVEQADENWLKDYALRDEELMHLSEGIWESIENKVATDEKEKDRNIYNILRERYPLKITLNYGGRDIEVKGILSNGGLLVYLSDERRYIYYYSYSGKNRGPAVLLKHELDRPPMIRVSEDNPNSRVDEFDLSVQPAIEKALNDNEFELTKANFFMPWTLVYVLDGEYSLREEYEDGRFTGRTLLTKWSDEVVAGGSKGGWYQLFRDDKEYDYVYGDERVWEVYIKNSAIKQGLMEVCNSDGE